MVRIDQKSQLSSYCHIFFSGADLLIGTWGSLDGQVIPYNLDTPGSLQVSNFQRVGIVRKKVSRLVPSF